MKKTLEEQGYKAVAIQDECFMGDKDSQEPIYVIVRLEKQGKKNILVKYDVKEFPTIEHLDRWMQENGIEEATPNEQFKAPRISQALHLIKAL